MYFVYLVYLYTLYILYISIFLYVIIYRWPDVNEKYSHPVLQPLSVINPFKGYQDP